MQQRFSHVPIRPDLVTPTRRVPIWSRALVARLSVPRSFGRKRGHRWRTVAVRPENWAQRPKLVPSNEQLFKVWIAAVAPEKPCCCA